MDSKLAYPVRQSNLIIRDKILMCVRYCVETVDRTLRAIMKSLCVPLGGKFILFSGDLSRGSRVMIVFMSLKSCPLFSHLKLLKLKRNMRLKAMGDDPCVDMQALQYPNYLLQIGEG